LHHGCFWLQTINNERYISASSLGQLFDRNADVITPPRSTTTRSIKAATPSLSSSSPAVMIDPTDGKEIVLVDTRNGYEYREGTFANALTMDHINEFKDIVTPSTLTTLSQHRNKRLVTFCTGGVRCEKVVPWLVQHGFDAVALRGGILAYIEHQEKEQEQYLKKMSTNTNSTNETTTGSTSTNTTNNSKITLPPSLNAWRGDCFVFDSRLK
jgi:predicted sulfurtransferase